MSEISEKEIAAARKAAGLTFTGTWLDNMVIAALEAAANARAEVADPLLANPAVPEGWQPIETAPENDHALFYVEDDGVYLDCLDRDGALLAASGDERIFATHWMPLPKPPVAAAEKEAVGVGVKPLKGTSDG